MNLNNTLSIALILTTVSLFGCNSYRGYNSVLEKAPGVTVDHLSTVTPQNALSESLTIDSNAEHSLQPKTTSPQGVRPTLSISRTEVADLKMIAPSVKDLIDNSKPPEAIIENRSENAWTVLRDNFGLDHNLERKRIKSERDWYAKHQSYIQRVTSRANKFLYHVLTETNKRGLPSELALLPIVESAYDPFAYSHGRASGIWQFIPSTARAYGLKQTWWYDGRRDIIESTNAALNYLEALNRRFKGNWLHALAAYNAGQGTVNKKRGLPTDFWSLKLPRETQSYVPKLIAISQIIASPGNYGLTLKPIPYKPAFKLVPIDSQMDLAQAAAMANITIKELYQFNPGFNQWATDPEGPWRLLIPINKVSTFSNTLAALPREQRVQWERYTIKPGDSLSTIAHRFHTTTAVLKEVNSLSGNLINAGKPLMIPHALTNPKAYSMSQNQRLAANHSRTRAGKAKTTHVVQEGESFWSISRRHKVNLRSLAKWNSMAPGDTLPLGRKLVVWKPAGNNPGSVPASRVRKINYKARSGDSYARIADKFNITLKELKHWNNINLEKYLQPGDRLTLYVDITKAP